ncbi:MAG: hypothetical protein KBS67_03970 [Bacteroidales bacterium]|nr:hypothetical protein [Candidatus Cryptobacteroides equifaecalis]
MKTILVYILNATPEVNFYGWDVVKFWCRQVLDRFFTYSWQVRTAYAIVVLCVISVLSLSFIFSGYIRKRRKKDDAYKKCKDRYIGPFRTILKTDYHLPTSSIEKICDCHIEDFAEFEGGIYAKLLCEIRNELSDVISLPNIQLLAELTGVRSWIENNLHKKNDIEISLELVVTMPIMISEGQLANYANYYDPLTKNLARQALYICNDNEPFRYLEEDLEEIPRQYRYMSLHRMFGWLYHNQKQMPSFMVLAEKVNNEKSASFMIEEIAYWGRESEKQSVNKFFYSNKIACRVAAIKVVAMLGKTIWEDALVESYQKQPEEVQMQILETITALKSGKQAGFLEKCYISAPSKTLAEQALRCLFNYNAEGKEKFEKLSQTPMSERDRNILEQIRSLANLEEKRKQREKELSCSIS